MNVLETTTDSPATLELHPHHCKLCGREYFPSDEARVPGTTRAVANETFTVWRCGHCDSLNALEPVDYDHIYRHYPIQRQRYDLFTRLLFAKRLRILLDVGIEPTDTILDYGCGSGYFVRFLQQHGYDCRGYDPYSESHRDTAVLSTPYDCVLCQDVIEHLDDPAEFLKTLLGLVRAAGRLVVGTPYSDHIDIHDRIDQVGVMHQPFHRCIVSMTQAAALFNPPGWTLERLADASYVDTAWPFANSLFLFHLFESGDRTMDFAFDPVTATHILRHPTLLFWAFFGRLFARSQNLVAVLIRDPHPVTGFPRPTPDGSPS